MSAASSHLDGLTSALHPSDSELFLRATGQPLHDLVSEIRNDEPLYHELFNDTGKSLLQHRLNAKGLAVFRLLLTRRHVDRLRERHFGNHPRYEEWSKFGMMTTRLKNFRSEQPQQSFNLTHDELKLLALASGSHTPLSSRRIHDEHMWITPNSRPMVFTDRDSQYQLHIDQVMPTWKVFVFLEPVTVERGPFHFVRGSQRTTFGKLRWLFERTNTSTSADYIGSPRHMPLEDWCHDTSECLNRVYLEQQRSIQRAGFARPEALTVPAGTMIIADTTGFHFRGLGKDGEARSLMGCIQTLDRPRSKLNIFQLPRRALLSGNDERGL